MFTMGYHPTGLECAIGAKPGKPAISQENPRGEVGTYVFNEAGAEQREQALAAAKKKA